MAPSSSTARPCPGPVMMAASMIANTRDTNVRITSTLFPRIAPPMDGV